MWSGAAGEGSAEDATVTTEVAHSGKNSIRLEAGSPNAGPVDLVLPFGGVERNVGTLKYSMWVYVTADNSAYFNFQGKVTIGTTWSLDNYFLGNGKFVANLGSANNGQLCEVDFEYEKWIKYELVANLTNNEWEIFLNDVSVAKFSNPNNFVSSIDLFPLYGADYFSSSSLYYVDDVKVEFTPVTLRTRDATLLLASMKNKYITGESYSNGGFTLRNLSTAPITAIDMTYQIDNGTETPINLTGLNVPSLGFYNGKLPAIIYNEGKSNLTLKIINVNGSADEDATNNSKMAAFTGITPAKNKVMVAEEATGTWCQFCPAGAVIMDSMTRIYPKHFIGVAVHNADPMVVPEYDRGVGSFPGFSGYPNIIFDRRSLEQPAFSDENIFDHITIEPPVLLTVGAKYDSNSRELQISVKGDFIQDVNGDYRFNLMVTENNVKFPGTGYRQVNAYANNARGWMGGYEKLPNPVPASRMTYNHVARAILDGFDGLQGYLPTTIKKGSSYNINYSIVLADTFKANNIELVGVMYGPAGDIVNATQATIAEAEKNGLSRISDVEPTFTAPKISPNPTKDIANLEIDLKEATEVSLQILDLTGKEVSSRNYGRLSGNVLLPVNTLGFNNGSYLIKLNVGGNIRTQKLVVTH